MKIAGWKLSDDLSPASGPFGRVDQERLGQRRSPGVPWGRHSWPQQPFLLGARVRIPVRGLDQDGNDLHRLAADTDLKTCQRFLPETSEQN